MTKQIHERVKDISIKEGKNSTRNLLFIDVLCIINIGPKLA